MLAASSASSWVVLYCELPQTTPVPRLAAGLGEASVLSRSFLKFAKLLLVSSSAKGSMYFEGFDVYT